MLKNYKNGRGITLVALVITIIILLILAGITISQLTGSGLFENAKLAEEKSKNSQEREEGILSDYKNIIGEYVSSNREEGPNAQNTWSGEEHFTGEYYFDKKPIYARSFYIPALSSSTTGIDTSYNHNISNVDAIWYDTSKSFAVFNSGVLINIPYTNSTAPQNSIEFVSPDSSVIKIVTGKNRSDVSAYVTVNYTKTTDTGVQISVPTLTAK